MTDLKSLGTAVFLSAFCYCLCIQAQVEVKRIWIAREDHGDKPGVEYRIWLTDKNRLVGEMWLFTTDENGKEKERGKYPTKIKTSDQKQITFLSGDGSGDEFTIRFLSGVRNRQEQAEIYFVTSQTKRQLKFERSGN